MGTRESERYSSTECEAAAADVLCLDLGESSPAGGLELGEDILGNWISICGEMGLCALCQLPGRSHTHIVFGKAQPLLVYIPDEQIEIIFLFYTFWFKVEPEMSKSLMAEIFSPDHHTFTTMF